MGRFIEAIQGKKVILDVPIKKEEGDFGRGR